MLYRKKMKISRRKRLTRVKGWKKRKLQRKANPLQSSESIHDSKFLENNLENITSVKNAECCSKIVFPSGLQQSTSEHDNPECVPSTRNPDCFTKIEFISCDHFENQDDHNNVSKSICVMSEEQHDLNTMIPYDPVLLPEKPSENLYNEVKAKFDVLLPCRWIAAPSLERDVFRLICISTQNNVTVQRSLEFSTNGDIKLYVHCREIPVEPFLENIKPSIPLNRDTSDYFVDRAVTVVNNVRKREICCGLDFETYRMAWSSCSFGEVDKNPYRERRYNETFRALNCQRLIPLGKWRCSECLKLKVPLEKLLTALQSKISLHAIEPSRFLSV